MAKYKVLLVEDIVVAQKIAVLTLSELVDCEVDIAETGKQALDFATRNYYNVIFMDLGLKDMDGFTVTENIRIMKNANHNTPIIALTAHASEEIKIKCVNKGINDYIAKPISFENADLILKKYLQR